MTFCRLFHCLEDIASSFNMVMKENCAGQDEQMEVGFIPVWLRAIGWAQEGIDRVWKPTETKGEGVFKSWGEGCKLSVFADLLSPKDKSASFCLPDRR